MNDFTKRYSAGAQIKYFDLRSTESGDGLGPS